MLKRLDTRRVKRSPFPDEFGVVVYRDIERMTCLFKRVRNGYVVKVFERKRFVEVADERRVVDHEHGQRQRPPIRPDRIDPLLPVDGGSLVGAGDSSLSDLQRGIQLGLGAALAQGDEIGRELEKGANKDANQPNQGCFHQLFRKMFAKRAD